MVFIDKGKTLAALIVICFAVNILFMSMAYVMWSNGDSFFTEVIH